MHRLLLLILSPLMLAFAPVPVLRPMGDPDRAIQQLEAAVQSKQDNALLVRKRRLVNPLKDLLLLV